MPQKLLLSCNGLLIFIHFMSVMVYHLYKQVFIIILRVFNFLLKHTQIKIIENT